MSYLLFGKYQSLSRFSLSAQLPFYYPIGYDHFDACGSMIQHGNVDSSYHSLPVCSLSLNMIPGIVQQMGMPANTTLFGIEGKKILNKPQIAPRPIHDVV